MKKLGLALILLLLFTGCQRYSGGEPVEPKKDETKQVAKKEETKDKKVEKEKSSDPKAEAEANAAEHPAGPGKMLYDKTEEKFKGMQYYFKGELVEIKLVKGILDNAEKTLLVKNDKGYIMPIFPPYEIDAAAGDKIEAWGPLSGDGYSSADLGVDNVVGVTGAMNATNINVNGETK